MTNEEIKKLVEEYFKEMLSKDVDYLDHVTDSWIDDAEDWFVKICKNFNVSFEEGCEFRQYARKRFREIYDEKYSARDALFELDRITCDVEQINKTFKRIKHHFKKFIAYTEAVTHQFEELEKCLQLLDDIENDRVESLKEKRE